MKFQVSVVGRERRLCIALSETVDEDLGALGSVAGRAAGIWSRRRAATSRHGRSGSASWEGDSASQAFSDGGTLAWWRRGCSWLQRYSRHEGGVGTDCNYWSWSWS